MASITVIHLERCKGCKWDYFEFGENEDEICWNCSRSYSENSEQYKTLSDLFYRKEELNDIKFSEVDV